MKLTPIRVRGKRGQPKPVKRSKRNPEDAANMKRARRHYGDADVDFDAARNRMKKTLPRLSQLPQEILERVFIASRNLSLPLVNRELHHRLSSDFIKYQLIGAAFGPTWDAWYGLDSNEVESYEGWISDVDRIEGDPSFQSAILACSWAKIPMLLTSFDVWIRQHANGRAYFTIPQLKMERLSRSPQPGSLYDRAYNTLIESDARSSSSSSSPPNPALMDMREKLFFDLDVFQGCISCPVTESGGLPPGYTIITLGIFYSRALLGSHLEVHPGTIIPDDLLAGPFESGDDDNYDDDDNDDDDGGGNRGGDVGVGEEKMERLFWLVRGGVCLQEEQTWEVTREGFYAMLELIKGTNKAGTNMNNEEIKRRLELAARLFTLFQILGVFSLQWPKYILQTSLAQVTGIISASQPGSAQVSLLQELATGLRSVLGRNSGADVYEHMGWRWRPRHVWEATRRPIERYRAFSLIRHSRAKVFLMASGREIQPQQAPEHHHDGGHDDGAGQGAVVVAHEPWSDFGLD